MINDKRILYECIELKQYDTFVQEYWKMIFHIIRKILNYYGINFDSDDIEDIRSLFMIEILKNDCKKLRQYDENKGLGLRLWIIMICRQFVQNYLRDNRLFSLKKRNELRPEEAIKTIEIKSLFEILALKEEEYILNKCLAELSDLDQLIIKLYYYDGYLLKEIATAVDKTTETVNTRKFRAIEKIKECLGIKN